MGEHPDAVAIEQDSRRQPGRFELAEAGFCLVGM